jgi:hypothetical protein
MELNAPGLAVSRSVDAGCRTIFFGREPAAKVARRPSPEKRENLEFAECTDLETNQRAAGGWPARIPSFRARLVGWRTVCVVVDVADGS